MSKGIEPRPIQEVTVKNYRPVERLSEETVAFSATIYLDGTRAGVATNQGHGGPNRYDFQDADQYKAFLAYAESWAKANGERGDAADVLIEKLCDDYELTRQARALLKRSTNTVILVEKGPRWFTDAHSGDP